MPTFQNLLLATNNVKKVKELREILGNSYNGEILTAADFPNIPDPEETGATFAENARLKAEWYQQRTGMTCIADDSGLVVDALGGRPGIYSARYAPTDAERISKMLKELDAVPADKRTARFVCALCVVTANGQILEETGTLEGRIGFAPAGDHGFGYDPIFLVHSGETTLAQLAPEEKNLLSHRGQAMKKISRHLLNALTLS